MAKSLLEKLKEKRKNLSKRYKELHDKSTEKSFSTLLDVAKLREKGVSIWFPKRDIEHTFDIIPFLAGKNHPSVEEGDIATCVDYACYDRIGPKSMRIPAQGLMFDLPDPILEYKAEKGYLPRDEWVALNEKTRCAYLVWVHTNEEEESKGIQVYDEAAWFMQEHLDEISKKPGTGEGYIDYSDFEEGKRIAFSIKSTTYTDKTTGEQKKGVQYKGHRFFDRPGAIPDEILEQVFALDEFMILKMPYDVVCKHFPKAKQGEEEKPSEEEKKEEVKQVAKDECPHGYEFGKDTNEYPECKSCQNWDHCDTERINREKAKERAKAREQEEEEKKEKADPTKGKKKEKADPTKGKKKKKLLRRKSS